jgi:hypothetical protein
MRDGTKQARDSYTTTVKRSIPGAKVLNREREDLGTIEDLVIDTRDSRITYAIFSFGGVFRVVDKHFAIPWVALAFNVSEKIAVLNVDKDRLNNAPRFDKDRWPIWRIRSGATKFTDTIAIGRIGKAAPVKRVASRGECIRPSYVRWRRCDALFQNENRLQSTIPEYGPGARIPS